MPRRVYGIYRSASTARMPSESRGTEFAAARSASLPRSRSNIDIPAFGCAGANYMPFTGFSAVKSDVYRVNPLYSLRNYMSDKYYHFSHRYKRTQFHRHYYHGQIDQYPYEWNFEGRGTATGQFYFARRMKFNPWQYGWNRFYDPYRRYYDPYHDSYIKLYEYRPRLIDGIY
ncbi:hypothetical protein niasHT_031853 [Heterodera trifolii]|uniref:Uncharacterized protein n=1 Tax=Heterodera trifolii TaxID=157864 RepID=A0ABD2HT45_9BILA